MNKNIFGFPIKFQRGAIKPELKLGSKIVIRYPLKIEHKNKKFIGKIGKPKIIVV